MRDQDIDGGKKSSFPQARRTACAVTRTDDHDASLGGALRTAGNERRAWVGRCEFRSERLAARCSGKQTTQWLQRVAAWLSQRLQCRADRRAAATLYAHLSRLSDPDLKHRGLRRATLAHDIAGACGGAARVTGPAAGEVQP